MATGSFTVTMRDTTGPAIANVLDIVGVEATSGNGSVVTYTVPTAVDAVDGPTPVSCSPASGGTFSLGTTLVTCSATDSRNNSSAKAFTVQVQDTTGPVLLLPATVMAEATSNAGASVTYSVPGAQDAVDGAITPVCTPTSGSTFALGTTEVTCTATDSAGNKANGSFEVTVRDTTPPTISGTPSARTVEATGAEGAAVSFTAPTATDLVDGPVPVTCAPASGSTFALGATTVTCSATDAAGNETSTSFTVTVQDTTPPALTLPADQVLAATGISGATATFQAQASDLVDGSVPVTCTPSSGSTFPIGFTIVNCSATDGAGNTAQGSFTVNVRRTISGLYQPVDMGRMLNTIKGGSTVPIKFEVFAGSTELTATDIIAPISVVQFTCPDGAPTDDIEVIATGNTSLRYDTNGGQYIYNWQTPKTKASCYQVMISTTDKASVVARFKTT
jgi:hypothetical protein